MSENFPATRKGISVTASTSPTPTVLGTDLGLAAQAKDALVDNRGTVDAFVLFGGADVATADTLAIRIPAGGTYALGKGNATYVSAYCASGTVPLVSCDALNDPEKLVARTVPLTCSDACGLFVLIPTPPAARTRNWLLAVAAKSASLESAHTNAPVVRALARWPAAKLCGPATFRLPPGIME